jgi:hypothetical protein
MKIVKTILATSSFALIAVSCTEGKITSEAKLSIDDQGRVEISCSRDYNLSSIPHEMITRRVEAFAKDVCRNETGPVMTNSKSIERTPGKDEIEITSSFECTDSKEADVNIETTTLCSQLLATNSDYD